MSDEIKYISIKEFQKLGFIHEINRQLLHPCGLALEVIIDTETGEALLSGVWDRREDPEGICFEEETLSAEKAASVAKLFHTNAHLRMKALGYMVQPVS